MRLAMPSTRFLKSKRQHDLIEEEKVPFVANYEDLSAQTWPIASRGLSTVGAILFWQILTICLTALSLFLFFRAPPIPDGGFERGFPTELDAAKPILSTYQVVFDGGPSFHDNGSEYLRPQPGKKYIGEPTQEIDDNWTELTEDRWFRLTPDEARKAWGDEYKEFWNEYAGAYLATIDSMHMIHCLDHIRKSFYPDYYGMGEGIHGDLHRDHCIDALRQLLMCNADLTPLPTRWYPTALFGIHYVDSDRPHTCRKWQPVRDWIRARRVGAHAVPPKHSPEHADDWRDF